MADLFSTDLTHNTQSSTAKKPEITKPTAVSKLQVALTSSSNGAESYDANDIEVLEGLEPVRHRPGMYIGGIDSRALHHLVIEVIDNSMDEAVAGHASRIEIEYCENGSVCISDNGRGIPIDPHPKYKDKSALEVILTTLHSGGKFSNKAYATSGGLHGVGISVVNALSASLEIEVARDRKIYHQRYERGHPVTPLTQIGTAVNRRGTQVTFFPDSQIFGTNVHFNPDTLFEMARSKAYLFRGVEIRWRCAPCHLTAGDRLTAGSETSSPKDKSHKATPSEEVFKFPNGLHDYLDNHLANRSLITPLPFTGIAEDEEGGGKAEWAIAWPRNHEEMQLSYCNTVPTPQGGTHESGLRMALLRGLKAYGELVGNKKISKVTSDDILSWSVSLLSVFIPDPQFQGQTKDRLTTPDAGKVVERIIRDRFENWLASDRLSADALLDEVIEVAEDRVRRREERKIDRKQPTSRRLRLPGKLADCSRQDSEGTEIFLVEGDSAGGSAKQARNRATQAILPLRGKILNVASASVDKLQGNQELKDLTQALGCRSGKDFDLKQLRYERVIIMTDADVDGAHIASLLMTFFYREMPGLIEEGYLYLAQPPLYRLNHGTKSVYARDEAHRDQLIASEFPKNAKIEISRFKGLGEMPPPQLKSTTMNPENRTLIKVDLPSRLNSKNNQPKNSDQVDQLADEGALSRVGDYEISQAEMQIKRTANIVETLMGKKPELRFRYIQENAHNMRELDI